MRRWVVGVGLMAGALLLAVLVLVGAAVLTALVAPL